jgi:hypothetical protein
LKKAWNFLTNFKYHSSYYYYFWDKNRFNRKQYMGYKPTKARKGLTQAANPTYTLQRKKKNARNVPKTNPKALWLKGPEMGHHRRWFSRTSRL